MGQPIEDYAVIGDCHTMGLVGKDGSLDWLCLPRFDSGACFARLLGDERHGRWLVAPRGQVRSVTRRYRPGTLVLESEFDTGEGAVRVVDCMTPRRENPDVIRVVEGVRGTVAMRTELAVRFDYGHVTPWVRRHGKRFRLVTGPDAVWVDSEVPLEGDGTRVAAADFTLRAGERLAFRITWRPSHLGEPDDTDFYDEVEATARWWRDWSARSTYDGEYKDAVDTSLIVLKALTYAPTGGVAAAATTSLPEQVGGFRNWDYRYCWLRDSTFTLMALMAAGYEAEAKAWREWLLRAVAGDPAKIQIMYSVTGERRLTELELGWLPGYQNSQPVRIGNGASGQFQLDVYGEIMDALHQARRLGLEPEDAAWQLQRDLLDYVESHWREPDKGIWEVRGAERHFTESRALAWAAVDRAIKAVDDCGFDGPVDVWRSLRAQIHEEVCDKGFDRRRGTFTQYYGSKELDAAALLLPLVGFLPATDERVVGTVAAIERELCQDGLVWRYRVPAAAGGGQSLADGEGAFLACNFWLADNYLLQGRTDEARAMFERLLSLRNDVGLLSEEYDPQTGRLVGNFPQAFSHVPLVNTARSFSEAPGGAHRRAQ